MPSRRFSLLLASLTALSLMACSPKEDTPAAAAAKASSPQQSLDAVSSQGRGFTVGAMMSANTVYVLFDPQCPHCGHLWQQSQPLLKKVKFVWIPVSFINAKSAPQGAALMAASNPMEAMTAHEASILAGTGGTAASSSPPAELEEAIRKNTQIFNSLGVESVPFILAKNQQTGQVVANTGAMETAALAAFLGIQ